MELEILKLIPAMADMYVDFFDATPHDDGVPEHKCYCVNWISGDGDGLETSTAEKRREAARKFVTEGKLQGYAAFDNGKMIGWLNANEKNACVNCPGWKWYMGDIPVSPAERTLSIFCFVIAPDYMRKGVATEMLKKALADAEAQGYDYAEAYPNSEFVGAAMDFRGPRSMYEKMGFCASQEAHQMTIMRKKLG